MTAEKKSADISDVIATYSSHVRENYPEPAVYRENMENLLASKRERTGPEDYILALERNIVFLSDLTVEAEALLEVALGSINEVPPPGDGYTALLREMEEGARKGVAEGHERVFVAGEGEGLADLEGLRNGDRSLYAERLEFHYSFLMTLRMLLFEFFNVLAAVAGEYHIERIDDAAPGLVMSNIEMTANYYLGNISVGEVVEDGKEE